MLTRRYQILKFIKTLFAGIEKMRKVKHTHHPLSNKTIQIYTPNITN